MAFSVFIHVLLATVDSPLLFVRERLVASAITCIVNVRLLDRSIDPKGRSKQVVDCHMHFMTCSVCASTVPVGSLDKYWDYKDDI